MTHVPDGADTPRPPELDDEVLDHYLAGRCTPAEWVRIDRWIAGDPRRRAILAGLRRGVTTTIDYPLLPNAARTEATIRGLQRDRHSTPPVSTAKVRAHPTRPAQSGLQQRRWLAGAAAFVASLGILIALMIHAAASRTTRSALLTHTYTTVAGQTATVLLQDGSSVTLGPATTLHISMGDTHQATVANVVGEAFFVITHHTATPLIVQTGVAEAKVLGTSFGVRQYAGDVTAHVAVTEGRVAVRGRRNGVGVGTPTVLSTRVVAQVDDSGQVRLLPETAVDEYAGWTAGHLVFHGAPLRTVISDLARTYGADIRVTDSLLAKQPVTLSASVSVDPLPAVLDFLARATDAHWEHVHGTLVLMPGRAASTTPLPSHFPTLEKHYGR